ncbi:hypothetical protein D3C80_920410 [compost metagenome]
MILACSPDPGLTAAWSARPWSGEPVSIAAQRHRRVPRHQAKTVISDSIAEGHFPLMVFMRDQGAANAAQIALHGDRQHGAHRLLP